MMSVEDRRREYSRSPPHRRQDFSRSPVARRPNYRSRSPGYRRDDYGRGDYGRRPPMSPPQRRAPRPVHKGTDDERARSTTVYVGNIPYSFIERDVSEMFERYGRIRKVTVPMDRFTRRNRGFAFVEYEDRRDAEDAFHKFNDYQIEGRRLRCDWDVGMDKKQVVPTTEERVPPPRSYNDGGDSRRPYDDRRPQSPPRRMRD